VKKCFTYFRRTSLEGLFFRKYQIEAVKQSGFSPGGFFTRMDISFNLLHLALKKDKEEMLPKI
jgi:hypothetical protein